MNIPLTLLSNSETPFAEYLGEILCTEGLPWFDRAESWREVGDAGGALLIPHGMDVDLSTVQAWLEAGAEVLAIRPPAALLELAGVRHTGGVAGELTLTLEPPFDSGTARAHGEVDLYELASVTDSTSYAHVLHDGRRHPAIVSAPCGRGHLVVCGYDLPRSIALTRQGNPQWSHERGTDFGSNTFRPVDLFVRGSGAETWFDFASAGAPHADMQQRLLAHLICSLSPMPIPRLWYLPHAASTVLTVLADSDASDPEIVSEQFDDVASFGGTMSAYLIDHTVDRVDAATVARWREAGHDVGVHPDYHQYGDASKPDRETMLRCQGELMDRLEERTGVRGRTIRNHSISWVGFAEQAKIERSLGVRLNAGFGWSSGFGGEPYKGPMVGYTNGSGQPQKFVDETGRVLDIYQLGFHVCDEMLKAVYLDADSDGAWNATRELIDASMKRWHSVLGLSFHPLTYDQNPEAKRWLKDCILPYARDNDILVQSAEVILGFADARRACCLEDLQWSGGQLSCQVRAPEDGAGLTLMVPTKWGGQTLADLTVDGAESPDIARQVLGGEYRLADVTGPDTEVVAQFGSG